MESKKRQAIGGVWIKEGNSGEYLSIQIEIDGKKINTVAWANQYKKPDNSQPDFRIMEPQEYKKN